MLRTLELGRAVLGSAAPDLELWLTTFITLLIPQPNTGLQQMCASSLFDLLSSGNVWVGRGYDMHLIIEPILGEEPLTDKHLQRLTECVVQAPLWGQLLLEPQPSHHAATSPGTIRLSLGRVKFEEADAGQKRRRSPTQVPVADVRPPDSVATVNLQVIRLCMSVLEPRQSARSTGKRLRVSISKDAPEHPEPEIHLVGQKRRRLARSYCLDRASQAYRVSLTEDSNETPAYCVQDEPELGLQETKANYDASLIQDLVEGAMRIAISGSLGKSSNGTKVKANTIRRSLSDIAPSLWKPGLVQALSQRAHFSPIISRSMVQMLSSRGISSSSSSLPAMLGNFAAIVVKDGVQTLPHSGDNVRPTALAGRIWMHMQKTLSNRPGAPLLPGVGSDTWTTGPRSDEMLADATELAISYALYDGMDENMADDQVLLLDAH
ncbi:hypothetical protein J1614_001665 [Plenodomus biglobosus]|nr:hypothetical protein J1614_001665 [Plenodomus biglobosus]